MSSLLQIEQSMIEGRGHFVSFTGRLIKYFEKSSSRSFLKRPSCTLEGKNAAMGKLKESVIVSKNAAEHSS